MFKKFPGIGFRLLTSPATWSTAVLISLLATQSHGVVLPHPALVLSFIGLMGSSAWHFAFATPERRQIFPSGPLGLLTGNDVFMILTVMLMLIMPIILFVMIKQLDVHNSDRAIWAGLLSFVLFGWSFEIFYEVKLPSGPN